MLSYVVDDATIGFIFGTIWYAINLIWIPLHMLRNIYCQLLNIRAHVCFSVVQVLMCSKTGANEQFSAKGILVFSVKLNTVKWT